MTVAVVVAGEQLGLSSLLTGLVAVVLALAMVQLLAHGMTFPLRQMVVAARAMARGDYSQRITATSRDEVGELARAFNSMATDLEQVDRMRRDLVANASHELRTPIGALRARLENFVDGVEPLDRGAAEELLAQVERLGDLVSQLLDLSKLESGAVMLERSPVAAQALLERVAHDWQAEAAARDVVLRVEVEDQPNDVDVDQRRMRQVLDNVVANAIRHSPEGGEVMLRAGLRPGVSRLEVQDDGPGIRVDEEERVFERFYRSDSARSINEGGSGLGLAIARWIVELHEGSIRVERPERTGCRVVIELPR